MEIFSICLGFLVFASQMLTGTCDSVEETLDFINRAQSELKLRNNNPNVTLVIGNTGSDISTLVHYVARESSKLVSAESKENENEHLAHDGQDSVAGEIESTTASRTLVSEMVVDEAGNVWYECPGFADSRNETVEIVETILEKTVIENASRVKIVLVTNYASVTNDRNDLDLLLTHAVHMIRDVDRYKNSIALVVSKTLPENSVKRTTVECLRNHTAILEKKGSSERKIQLIDNLLAGTPNKEHPKISILWHPDGAIPTMMNPRQKIRESILEDTSYTESQPNDFGFPLTDRALIHIQNIVRHTFNNISEGLTIIDRSMLNALQLKIRSYASFYDRLDLLVVSKSLLKLNKVLTLKQLTDEFTTLNEALNLTSIDKEINGIAQHERNVKSLTSIAHTEFVFPIRDGIANASKTIEYLASEQKWYSFLVQVYEFFASYDAQQNKAAYNVANLEDWGHLNKPQGLVIDASNFNIFTRKFPSIIETTPPLEKLIELNEIIEFALQFPSQYECSGEVMTIRGNFVKSSDIKPWKCGSISKITVFVVHTFFVDNDLNLNGYKELKIYADKWIVLREATFNLNGFDGEAQSRPQSPGTPGRRGNSGTNAGNFFGLSREMIRGNLLTINANGGNGAAGQDGTASDDVVPTFTRTKHEDSGTSLAIPSPHEFYRRFLINDGYDAELTHPSSWFKNVLGISDGRVRNRFRIHPKKCCGKTGLGGPGGAGGLSGNYIFIEIGISTYGTPMFNLNDGLHGRKGGDAEPCRSTALDIIVNTSIHQNLAFIVKKYSFKTVFCIENHIEDIRCRTRYEYTTLPVQSPSPRLPLDFISSIIEYKTFLRANMRNSLVEITYTYDAINSNPDISQAYTVVDFIAELTSLEKQFNELKEYVDLMPFYNDILNRIENYVITIGEKQSVSDQEVFALLYSTILSRTLCMRSGHDSDLIIDIENFFDIIIDNVHKLDETARILMIEEHRTKYNEGINTTIDEAMDYVRNEVRPEIKKLFLTLDIEMREVLDETLARQANTNEELKSKLGNAKLIRRYAMLRKVADVFHLACETIPFLGTRGKIFGNLINIGVAIRKNAMVDPEVVEIELPAGVTRVQNELDEHLKASVRNRIDAFESELCKLNSTVSGMGFDKFNDQLDTLISLGKIIQLRNPLVNDDINRLFGNFSEFVHKQQKELATVEGTAEILENLEKTANVLVVIETSITMYRQFLNKNERLDAIGQAINADRKALIALKVIEAEIVAELVPMINGLQYNIDDVQKNLNGKSLVALDVQQWKVHETLRSVERKLLHFIGGFKNEYDVENCLIKICEAFNLIVNIYDRIQNYQDQSKLVTYLSDLQSVGRRHLRSHNAQFEDLQFNLQANIILSQYNRAIEAFKQAAFPFAARYLDMYQLPAALSVDRNISSVIAAVADRAESLSTRMKELNTTVINEDDGRIHLAYFDRDSAGIQPFYVWPNNEVKDKLNELFDGKKIYLTADVKRSSKWNAIKFNVVDLQFHSSNQSISEELNRILQSFHVSLTHMGESDYRCNDQFYTINSRPQTIKYSFGKRNQEPVDRSVVYDKLRSGVKLLSPYTLWAIQLSRGPFEELKPFVDSVDIELHGKGQYVNEGAGICNTDLGKYYSHMSVL